MIGWRKAQIYKRYSYFWANILLVKEKKICRFLGQWGKNQNSPPNTNILFALFSHFQKGVTQLPCPKTLGGDRYGGKVPFRGLGLTQRAAGSEPPAQKLLAKRPGNLTIIQRWGQKIFHIVAVTDRQTDRRTDGRTDGRTERQTDRETDRQTERQTDRLKFFFLNYFIAGGDRKLWTWKISTISLRKVCFAHFTRVG